MVMLEKPDDSVVDCSPLEFVARVVELLSDDGEVELTVHVFWSRELDVAASVVIAVAFETSRMLIVRSVTRSVVC